jgi:hypothetical protein
MNPFNSTKDLSKAFARALLLVLVITFGLGASSSAAESAAIDASVVSFSRPVRAKVQALGLGATVRVGVFRHRHYRGYITRIDENSFEVTDRTTLSPNTFMYQTVSQVAGRRLPDADIRTKPGITTLFHAVSRFGFGP